ncbi:MAG: thioredoxin family protein [Steroidobacteraceae bacterium]|jgi:thioredoxin 1
MTSTRIYRTRIHWAAAILMVLCASTAAPVRSSERDIYPAPSQAQSDLAAALAAAAAAHKRIIVDFGGNWCTDCHVLDSYFHDSSNKPLLDASFILVHVNIGRIDENVDIAERYGIPLHKGVPALAVLDERGKLLYSQKAGEFEAMRGMQSAAVTEFLRRWKPPAT